MLSLIPTEAWEYNLVDVITATSILLKKRDENKLLQINGVGKCYPVRSGRVGILIALKALSLRPFSKIGVPLYCCPVVFKAIKMAGHMPVFVDVDKDNYCLSIDDLSSKASALDALIAVHMFGQTCNIYDILQIMRDKPVIEDAAQSLGSLINGKLTGTFGQLGVFSFRSGKYLTSGEGGAIFCQDEYLGQKISTLIKEMEIPDIKSELAHVFETYLRTKLRSKPLWGLLGTKIWKIYNRKISFIDKSPIFSGQAYTSDLKITEKRMTRLNQMINKQRENADFYLNNLIIPKDMFCLEPPNRYYNRFMFPIKFNSEERCQYISDLLQENNISTSRPYLDVIEGSYMHYNYQRNCPVAERLLKTTLIIPVHYRLHQSELAKIADILNAGWKSISNWGN